MIAALLFLWAPPARAEVPDQPPIHARAEWTSEAVVGVPEDPHKTRIVIHHTAELVTDQTKALTGDASWQASLAHARRARNFHKRIRGWKDIGYHYMIDWEGRILEGRPIDLLGAHVEKHNTGAIGVVLMGDLSRQRPTARQTESLGALLRWLMWRYDILARNVGGHYEMKYTICPGTYLGNLWQPDAKALDFVQIRPRPKNKR